MAGESIKYSAIRTILYESLPYRIVLGLSKIFVGGKEYSLRKTVNVAEQMNDFKDRDDIKLIVKEILKYLDTSEMVSIITSYRDQFFAHLDKICVLSDCRIDPTIALKGIDRLEINEFICLIGKLYMTCFNQELAYAKKDLSEKDIIQTFFWM